MPVAKLRPMLLIAFLLPVAACTAAGPNALATANIDRGPNPFPRGTDAFCKRYGEQTFASTFDLHAGIYSDAWAENQARVAGEAAYERCKSGRTN